MLTWKKSGDHTLSALPGSAQRFVIYPWEKREILGICHAGHRNPACHHMKFTQPHGSQRFAHQPPLDQAEPNCHLLDNFPPLG
jgi:hypothetical protein